MENSYLLGMLPDIHKSAFRRVMASSYPFSRNVLTDSDSLEDITGSFSEDEILAVALRMFPLPFLEFERQLVDKDALTFSDVELYKALVLEKSDHSVLVATPCPWNAQKIRSGLSSEFKFESSNCVQVVCCSFKVYSDFVRVIRSQRGIDDENFQEMSAVQKEYELLDLTLGTREEPVSAFLGPLFESALDSEASDIHIFSSGGAMKVQMRIGSLVDYEIKNLIDFQTSVRNRLVGACGLNQASSKGRLDGKLRVKCRKPNHSDPVVLDVRYAEIQSVTGPDITLRLLDTTKSLPDMDRMFEHSLHAKNEVIRFQQSPSGTLVTSGPTGSGKTTTLSVLVAAENNGRKRIYTVEDPVEYQQAGIGQIDVTSLQRPADVPIGSFNPWLEAIKSLLRKDPDIVMVGEIRDPAVAEQTVQMSISGHSVYTTLHLESAPQIIERVESFGIDAYKFVSSLRLVLAQRLVPKICPYCSKEMTTQFTNLEDARVFFKKEGLPQYWSTNMQGVKLREANPVGCGRCSGRGYSGFSCILEGFPFRNDVVRNFVAERVRNNVKFTVFDLEHIAKEQDWPTLGSLGLNLIRKGLADVKTLRALVDLNETVLSLDDQFERELSKKHENTENDMVEVANTMALQGEKSGYLKF